MFSWINDRDLVVLSSPFKPVARAAHDEWFDNVRLDRACRILVVTDGMSDQAIGYCQLKGLGNPSENAELQIRIGEKEQLNKGIGTAAVVELLNYGFEALNLHRIFLHVFRTNVRAHRAYLKAGFAEEGILREGVKIDAQFIDVIVMGILRREFLSKRRR